MTCAHGYETVRGCPFCRRMGLHLKEQGQAIALAALDEEWEERALSRMRYLAHLEDPFTAEDLIESVGLPHESSPNRNNAVGALFTRLARKGIIKRVGYTSATRPESHGRVIALWQGRR